MSEGTAHPIPRLRAVVVIRGDGRVAVTASLARVGRAGGRGRGGGGGLQGCDRVVLVVARMTES